MSIFKKALNFYIQKSLHVGLSLTSMTWHIALVYFSEKLDYVTLSSIFLLTTLGYNIIKNATYLSLSKLHFFFLKDKFYNLILLVLFIINSLYLPSKLIWIYTITTLISMWYAYDIVLIKKTTILSLRKIPYLKVFIVALIWTWISIGIPISKTIRDYSSVSIIHKKLGILQLIWVIMLMIPFEIRDIEKDHRSLRTIPQKLGINTSKILGVILGIIRLYYLYSITSDKIYFNILFIEFILYTTLLLTTCKKSSLYHTSFWVESLPIITALLVFFK